MSVGPEDKYDIFFVDFGDSEYLTLDQLRPLPGRFQNEPFHAIECSLTGLQPVEGT